MSVHHEDGFERENPGQPDQLDQYGPEQWGQVSRPLPPPAPTRRSLLTSRVTWRSLLLVIAGVVAFRLWVVESAIVDGNSMSATLQSGEWVFVLKPLKPHRFSVVVLTDPQANENVVKRVVGLPGDEVSSVPVGPVSNDPDHPPRTRLTVNGVPYEEPYARSTGGWIGPVRVPDDSYYVLGDNRDDSVDSRVYGPVKRSAVRGVAVMVVYPFPRMSIIPTSAEPVPAAGPPVAQ